jgi:hypothetical protein
MSKPFDDELKYYLLMGQLKSKLKVEDKVRILDINVFDTLTGHDPDYETSASSKRFKGFRHRKILHIHGRAH